MKNLLRPSSLLGALFFMATLGLGGSLWASSPWAVGFDPRFGLSLRYEGVPIIRQSTLYIVSPDWTPVLYNQDQTAEEVERFAGEGGPGLTVTGGNEIFAARYRLEALDERRFRIEFEGELLQDVPAHIEFASGYFNANILGGAPFRGETPEGLREGRVPDFPVGIDQHGNEVLPNFRWVEFQSRIGRLRVDVDAGGERVMFFDARRDPEGWARRAPVFWSGLGVPTRPLTYGEPIRFTMLVTIDAEMAEAPSERTQVAAEMRETAAAQSPRDRPVQVIPTPKRAEIGGRGFVIDRGTRWTIRLSEEDPRLEATLRSILSDYHLDLAGRVERVGGNAPVEVILGRPGRLPRHAGSDWYQNPEGYRLVANRSGIAITAATAQGAFYGLQTMAQLLRPLDEGVLCHAARIEDWPSMQFRGTHWFPSASGVPFHQKLIERIMAAYKLNETIIQCEAAVWDSHPAIAAPNSIGKDDLQGLVDLARSLYINPIPLVNVPGHAEWIFRNGQNMHFVEDPETPYAYCVNHPDSFRFITDIMTEAIEIFRPNFFHLGHDEVTMIGRFPHPDCPRCQGETATSLVIQHMHTMNEWLQERNIGLMIWGDMMLAKEEIPDTAAFAPNVEEARIRRANIPDGTVVTDWHYYGGEEYPSLELFHAEGHPTIASTWYTPQNIHHFSQAALAAGSLGLLQTTWAGYFPDEQVLNDALYQFTAFILAAEYAWTGRSDPPPALPFEPGTEFTRSYFRLGFDQRPGSLVSIAEAARTPREGWLGLNEGWDFEGLPRGEARLGDVLFQVPEHLVVVGGRLAPETAWKEVAIEVGGTARQVALLNAAAFGTPEGTTPVRMLVHYVDGSRERVPLVMGRTTAHWGQDTPTLSAPVAWQKLSPAGTPIALRVTRWTNPHPERPIARIVFEAVDPEQAWALAGLTLLE